METYGTQTTAIKASQLLTDRNPLRILPLAGPWRARCAGAGGRGVETTTVGLQAKK